MTVLVYIFVYILLFNITFFRIELENSANNLKNSSGKNFLITLLKNPVGLITTISMISVMFLTSFIMNDKLDSSYFDHDKSIIGLYYTIGISIFIMSVILLNPVKKYYETNSSARKYYYSTLPGILVSLLFVVYTVLTVYIVVFY